MKQSLLEHWRISRKIRKLNREVGPARSRRGIAIIFLILVAIAFVVFEVCDIVHSKYRHDEELTSGLVSDAAIELSYINTGFITGDQTVLKKAYQQYLFTLDQLNRNSYMQKEQGELLHSLNEYRSILDEEVEDAHLIKFRTAIKMLQAELGEVSLEKVSVKEMLDVKEALEDFRDSLAALEDERFAAIIAKFTDYSNELIKLIDKSSVCIGVCSEKNFRDYLSELEKIFTKYQSELAAADTKLSEYYSPSSLINSLEMLQ